MDRQAIMEGEFADPIAQMPSCGQGLSAMARIACPDDWRMDDESQARLIIAAMVCPLSWERGVGIVRPRSADRWYVACCLGVCERIHERGKFASLDCLT